MLIKLWNYLRGYVIILVKGYFLEKFINISIHRQIFLWDINRLKSNEMALKVSIKGFKMLRPIAKKTGCRVKILKKKGLPFTLKKCKARKAFILGLAIFIAMLYFLTSFIWVVEVTGNDKLDTKLILERLESFGVKPGVMKFSINTDAVVENMMIDMQELAWMGIVIKGTKAKVEVVERKTAPEPVKQDIPCDIVASRDGIIKNIYVKAGQEAVKPGDTVIKGQLLISGRVKGQREDSKERLVHAMGEVEARTWYEGSCEVSTSLLEKKRTGNSKANYTIFLFNKEIPVLKRDINFECFDKVETKKELSIGKDIVLPFKLIVDRFYENSIIEREISLDEAKKIAADKAYEDALKGISPAARIVKKTVKFLENENGKMEANVIVECLENIGLTREIGGN